MIILITGASSGMGKATALKLIEKGHTVYGVARRIEKMHDIIEKGGKALQMDITKDEDIKSVVNNIISEQGIIDVLINNAGYAIYGAVEDVSIEDARRQFEVNLFGLARLTQLVLPYMRKNKKGKIINISSIGGKIYTPLGAWYHATKHALEGWSDCLRFELKPFGVDVVIIEPGAIDTEWSDIAMESENIISESAYSSLQHKTSKMMQDNYKKGKASSPNVISEVIIKAINSNNPKTRYIAGSMSKLAIFGRWLLSDKLFDKYMNIQIR